MTKKSGASSGRKNRQADDRSEQDALLRSLRKHGQVVESEDPDVPLGPGQTHVLVKKPGKPGGQLIERRKSFFKR